MNCCFAVAAADCFVVVAVECLFVVVAECSVVTEQFDFECQCWCFWTFWA